MDMFGLQTNTSIINIFCEFLPLETILTFFVLIINSS